MEVFYNNKIVNNNELLKPSETQTKPQIKYSFENNKLYTLLMHDPDSVYGNRFHWIVANISGDVKMELTYYHIPDQLHHPKPEYIVIFLNYTNKIEISM